MNFFARVRYCLSFLFFLIFLVSGLNAHAAENALKGAMRIQQSIEQDAATTQKKIDQLSDEARQMLQEFRSASQEAERLEAYNNQLEKLVDSQIEEVASVEKQITEVDVVQQGVIPLMLKMVDALERFNAYDLPFLPEERNRRFGEIKAMMDKANITTAEKYRRILEAYQIEVDYGRTMEASRRKFSETDERTVDFLRIGRMMLFYQTLDGQESGYWDRESNQWKSLPGQYRQSINYGLRMARDQVPPDLLVLPTPTPEVAQ